MIKFEKNIERQVLLIKGFANDEIESYAINNYALNYSNYFKSIAGGAWEETEIIIISNPLTVNLKSFFENNKPDYAIIVLIGHGATQNNKQLFKVNKDEIIQAGEFNYNIEKQLIIIESCRCSREDIPFVNLTDKVISYKNGGKFLMPLNRKSAKKLYNVQLMNCKNGIVVCFACKKNEVARNFFFSKTLLESSHNWHLEPNNQSEFLGIKTLMEITSTKVMNLSLNKKKTIQTPEISGEIDFPFAISKY